MTKSLALIGNGAIARIITDFVQDRPNRFQIVGALNITADEPSVGDHPLFIQVSEVTALHPDLVIECAGQSAVVSYVPDLVRAGLDVMVLSSGALADDATRQAVLAAAEENGAGQITVPAGALPGIDGLSAAKAAGLDTVTLTSTKPARAWKGTPAEDDFALEALETATVIFEGSARDAALKFPKNANVAATAALAGIGFEKTQVRLVADPNGTHNTHELDAVGAFGTLAVQIKNEPSPSNPKTSYMAALSVLRALENLDAQIVL